MPTIDRLDISVHDLYAKRQMMVEQINQQFRLQEAETIPAQTQVLNLNPQLTELDILLGVIPLNPPWAFFPVLKTRLRRSPFVAFRVASSLGSLEDQANLVAFIQGIKTSTPEEEEEKQAILDCFSQVDVLNEWMGYIFGRKGQFLQG